MDLSGSVSYDHQTVPYARASNSGGERRYDESIVNNSSPSGVSISVFHHQNMSNDSTVSRTSSSSAFKIKEPDSLDIISPNFLSEDTALACFQNFFMGCDRFVPVFDPRVDTFESVRSRSSLLLNAICTIGYRTMNGTSSQTFQLLNKELKGRICEVILGQVVPSVETVQALLVIACYSEKGWMLTSVAIRMAVQLDLPGAYEVAVRTAANAGSNASESHVSNGGATSSGASIFHFRKARTWLGLFVLEHIFSLDCGKPPGIEAQPSVRRCRILVSHPERTALDLRLLSQVELNYLRSTAHSVFSNPNNFPAIESIAFIRGMKIDLDIWLEDWLQIMLNHTLSDTASSTERDTMLLNLRIQREWAEIVMCCRALQCAGITNIAVMSPDQHCMITWAKEAAQRHLEKLLERPDLYLATLRYSMDFVWAKCAFSVLLLLKMAILLPGTSNMPKLLMDARNLLKHLENIHGAQNIYFLSLSIGVDKAQKALDAYIAQDGESISDVGPQEAEIDFESYVPKEFMFEWDFPGLSLCFVPIDLQELFSEYTNM